jgi:S1-C subfamily serine protease
MELIMNAAMMGDVGGAAADVAARVQASVVEIRPKRGGAGAGTIWRRDGLIVTNYHVSGRHPAGVRLADGRTFDAEVVAWDARNDLALLSVPAHDLPAANVGDARRLRAGELVIAVGHPYGVRNAVTVGVVNHALPHRPVPAVAAATPETDTQPPGESTVDGDDQGPRDPGQPGQPGEPRAPQGRRGRGGTDERNRLWRWGQGRELVMADVLLGPGNSGGPLADSRGRVVGINAMVADGLALAVPSHLVDRLLARPGEPPRLGVGVQDVDVPAALAAQAGVDPGPAAILVEVVAGSPAERAGLLIGDVLVAVDGVALDGSSGLPDALESHTGGPLALTLIRGGRRREVAALLDGAAAPAAFERRAA